MPRCRQAIRVSIQAGAIAAALLAACLIGHKVHAQPMFSTEYDIKAALLFNLTQFTEFAPTSFTGPEDPIVIGVLGDNPFGTSLDKLTQGEKLQNRPVITRYIRSVDEARCHVLFVSRSQSSQLDKISAQARRTGTLTVSDIERFSRRGGMVEMFTERNRVRLSINVSAVEAAGLKISSKLLRISELVKQ